MNFWLFLWVFKSGLQKVTVHSSRRNNLFHFWIVILDELVLGHLWHPLVEFWILLLVESLFDAVHVNDRADITVEIKVEDAHGVCSRKIHLSIFILKLFSQTLKTSFKSLDLFLFLVISRCRSDHKFGKGITFGLECELMPSHKLVVILSLDVVEECLLDNRECLLEILKDVFYLSVWNHLKITVDNHW